MTWNRTTGATSRALRTDPVIVDGIPRHSVRIPAKPIDRKSTRLNSSHLVISYAVFCLKKKKKKKARQKINKSPISSRNVVRTHYMYASNYSCVALKRCRRHFSLDL